MKTTIISILILFAFGCRATKEPISYISYSYVGLDTACVRWMNDNGIFCLTPCVIYKKDAIK